MYSKKFFAAALSPDKRRCNRKAAGIAALQQNK